MLLQFCTMSHMRYHKKWTWIRSLNVIFCTMAFLQFFSCGGKWWSRTWNRIKRKRLCAPSWYPSSLTKIGICMYDSGFCCMRTEMEDSLMHMLYCSRLMYSTWIPTKYKKTQRSALIIEFADIIEIVSQKYSTIKCVVQIRPKSHPVARPVPCSN